MGEEIHQHSSFGNVSFVDCRQLFRNQGSNCKAVALQIQNNNVQQIREKFNVADPNWSAEELQKLKDENAWAYEINP